MYGSAHRHTLELVCSAKWAELGERESGKWGVAAGGRRNSPKHTSSVYAKENDSSSFTLPPVPLPLVNALLPRGRGDSGGNSDARWMFLTCSCTQWVRRVWARIHMADSREDRLESKDSRQH